MCKLKKYVKTMLCIALSAAMIFADTPVSAFAKETEIMTQESGAESEEQNEISTEDGVTEKETEEAETADKTEENVAEQDGKTDSEEEAIADEAETKTEQPLTAETALETETEEFSTKDAEAESEVEESTQESLLAGTDIANGVYKEITWAIDADGKLTVEGTGDFSEYTGKSRAPWALNSEKIKSAEIKVSGVTNASYMFYGCSNLRSVNLSGLDTTNVTDMSYMFYGCDNLIGLNVSGFDTANVTDMSYMFSGCGGDYETSLDLSRFNTSNVTDMSNMFQGCYGLSSLDISGFDTTNVTSMSGMFQGCGSLRSLDVRGFNTTNVTDMSNMFQGCEYLESLDVRGFNTTKVTSMSRMFGCGSVTSLDLSRFDTSNVTDMSGMFQECRELTSLDLSSFDTSKVTSMSGMFQQCRYMESLNVSGFDTTNVTDMSGMFQECRELTSLDLSSFDTTKVTSMSGMFQGCGFLKSLDVRGFNTTKVTSMSGMFQDCEHMESLNVSGFDTSNVTDMSNMFYGCVYLESLDVSGFDTSKVTNMSGMFVGGVSSLDLSGFDTSNVTDMSDMFGGCRMSSLDVSSFDTSKVTNMSDMFSGGDVTSLDLSGFDTSKVTDMSYMFASCTSVTSLDLSSFDTSKVTDMNGMFSACIILTSLDLSSFDTSNVTSMFYMFDRCYELESLDISGFDMSKVTNVRGMFEECEKLSSIRTPYNVKISASLPAGDWYDMAGNKYTELPKELPNSILLAKGQIPTPVTEHIEAVKQKTVYFVGDTVNTDDLTVKYYGSDGTVKILTNKEYTTDASTLNMTTAGKKLLTITYNGGSKPLTAEITLTVNKTGGVSGGDGEETDDFPVTWEYPENLKVERTALTADNIEVKAKNRTYDGTPYTPDIKVTVTDSKGKKTVLTEGTDYSVKYSNNIKAGEGTVTIKGNGAYTGTLTKTFTISPKQIKKLKTVAGGIVASENASAIKLQDLPIYVYDGTKKLTYDEDYTLTITKGDAAKKGKLEVAVSAKDGSNYTGTGKDAVKATVTVYEATGKNFKGIIHPDDVAFETASDASQTYTGKALKPAFKVTINNTELGKKDFTVKYTNNKEAGTAYATITGKGGYVGSVVKTFEITPVAESSGFTLKNEIKAPTYNGKIQKPKVTIVSGNKTLKAGKDYQIAYSNNLHATPENAADKDKAKITVTGIGNYKGMKGTFYFEINRLEIKKASVKGTEYDLDITYAKHRLVENHDYEITDTTPDGKKVKVTLTGKGDFTGTVTKSVKAEE